MKFPFARRPQARLAAVALAVSATLAACGGSDDPAPQPPAAEATPASLTLEKIGGYTHTGGEASAEITAHDPLSQGLFVVNGALGSVDVLDLSDPSNPVSVGSITAKRLRR